jgi:CRISPR-associated protein Csx10
MNHLSVRMKVESPLAIRSDQALEGAAGSKYVPGTTFIGGLASLYRLLYQDAPEMDAFAPLFLSGQVLYPNLYPALFDDEGIQGQNTTPVSPLPKTAQSCKRHEGFRFPDDGKNDGHGVRDTLIDWALCELASSRESGLTPEQRRSIQLTILHESRDCQMCKQPMDHYDGYYRRSKVAPYPMSAAKTESRLQTHTGIHRESGTVQESILYNRQVFAEGMQFWGEILVPDDEQLLTPLTTFLDEIGFRGLLRLGTGRTRGMGKVTLAVEEPDEEEPDEEDRFTAFKQRLQDLNEKVHKRAQHFKLNLSADEYFFALTLHSPLILTDDLLRYQGTIDTNILANILDERFGVSVPDLKIIYSAASIQKVAGWQELWGTPRTSEYAIESGSVFLFSGSGQPDAKLLSALFALEEQGVGKRRTEGFGRICVSDQFHQQVEQEAE